MASAPLAEVFKALSHPHRLGIFLRLARCCGRIGSAAEMRACVGQLGAGLGIAPSTVSHHIKELRRSGLVHMRRRGRNVECWVEAETLAELAKVFQPAPASRRPLRKRSGADHGLCEC